MFRFLIGLICVFLTAPSYGQTDLLINAQLGLGGYMGNTYSANKKIIAPKFPSYHTQERLSLQYRGFDRIAIEFGVGQNFQNWKLHDRDFEKRHGGFEALIKNKNYYTNVFGNFQLLQKISDNLYLYEQAGYSLNMIGSQTLTASRLFVKDNETVDVTTIYAAKNNSIYGEVGIQTWLSDRSALSFGLNVNLGRSNMIEGFYTTRDANGALVSSDRFSSKGSYIGLTMKYGAVFFHKDKRVKTPKPPKPVPSPKETPVAIKTPEPTKPVTPPVKVEGRDVTVTHKVEVKRKKVTIKVWDHEKVDGDIISLNLNGKWILEKYTLEKKQYIFEVELQNGVNYFVLHALNLGEYSPNTAAVIVDDGATESKIVLKSTLQMSGTIEITVK